MYFPYLRGRQYELIALRELLENNKLGTLCKYFNIDFQAHDSLEDIVATKKLIKKIVSILETCEI